MDKPIIFLFLVASVLNQVYHGDSSSSSSSVGDSKVAHADKNYYGKQEKVVVCYFTNWALSRSGIGSYTPENINASLCTHIIYAFASLDNTTLTIVSYDPSVDIEQKFYKLVTAFKKFGLKVLISIGGWNNSAGDRWSRLISNRTARAKFVSSVVAFLKKYNFDGLDVDYEYPGCPQGDFTAGLPSDSTNFNRLLSELKAAFAGKYLLTAATGGTENIVKKCYNMTEMCQILDIVNVMAYDYHSASDGETGANAPFYGTKSSWGVLDTITYYINDLQCPVNRVVMGIPFYGKTYILTDTSLARFGAPVSGPGKAGTYSDEAGTLAYYEICLLAKSGYKFGHNSVNGSYAWSGNQFISYDGPTDIIRKSKLIKQLNLKGAMFWTLDYDDFNNVCGCGSYPLLTTLNQQLRGLKGTRVNCYC